jgi:hypothetical protein
MDFFLGITFSPNYMQFAKIDSFRKRFDSKYLKSPLLHMALIPAFSFAGQKKGEFEDFHEHMAEEIEGHLMGLDEVGQIQFVGMDFHYGRSGILYLRPKVPVDLIHCQENLRELLKSYGANFKRPVKELPGGQGELQLFLPVGRFDNPLDMEAALALAQVEFSIPFTLRARDIMLFEKTPTQWVAAKKLFTFPCPDITLDGENPDFNALRPVAS